MIKKELYQILSLEQIKNRLATFGLKATHQRLVVYDAMQKIPYHPSAEDIYALIHTDTPTITLATVYNTLDCFAEAKVISRVLTEEGKNLYDFDTGTHHHIYITNTDEIVDYHDPELQKLIEDYLKQKNIHNLEIRDLQLHIKAEKIDVEKDISIE
ncbi:MAG: transcriptional repressor [Cytophagales bacterium]|nr:transcriptional repressor [Cytophaga sp.]